MAGGHAINSLIGRDRPSTSFVPIPLSEDNARGAVHRGVFCRGNINFHLILLKGKCHGPTTSLRLRRQIPEPPDALIERFDGDECEMYNDDGGAVRTRRHIFLLYDFQHTPVCSKYMLDHIYLNRASCQSLGNDGHENCGRKF